MSSVNSSSFPNPGPLDLVTREHLSVLVLKAKGQNPSQDLCESETPFPDVTREMWSCGYIKTLKELWAEQGITPGLADGTFAPHGFVTREQMAAFLVRTAEGDPPRDYCKGGSPFQDVAADMWSCKYIKRLQELGVARPAGRYYPSDTVTYGEVEAAISAVLSDRR